MPKTLKLSYNLLILMVKISNKSSYLICINNRFENKMNTKP